MNVLDVFTSSDDQNRQSLSSQNNRDNTSTDIQRSIHSTTKTKNIKKKYQPIEQNGHTYHYQNDPVEYKRIRKKVQNRLSARRVRGRKQTAFDSLEQQVDYLRKVNSEIQLKNARLETQNKNLKEQLLFMKELVKPGSNLAAKSLDPIDKYLSEQALTTNKESPMIQHNNSEFQSPFMDEEESDWLRLPNRTTSRDSWTMLAIFTLVLAVFVLPSENTQTTSPSIFYNIQNKQSGQKVQVQVSFLNLLLNIILIVFYYGKICFKYLLVFGYICLIYMTGKNIYCKKKLKKI